MATVYLRDKVFWLASAMLLAHGALLGFLGYRNGPGVDEMAHLVSGYSHWVQGDFSHYRVNPPLIRILAAIPMHFCSAGWDWVERESNPFSRPEFGAASRFMARNGEKSFFFLMLARWMLIPVSLLGGFVCFQWASQMFGKESGLVALTLWCFCPNMLTWGASITPDTGAASFGVLCAWRYWHWLRCPTWPNAILAGLTLGLAQLSKSTWIILFLLWPFLLILWRFFPAPPRTLKPSFLHFWIITATAVYLVNLGYAFEESGMALRDFTFVSNTLGGPEAHEHGGNRFRNSWLGRMPVPVPANYFRGIDIQKYELELGKWSYLRGQHKYGGWWYYYIYALIVKTPIGYLAAGGMAAILFVRRGEYRSDWQNELLVILPGLAVFMLVSSQTGFNRYLRYVLPSLPFLCLFTSRAAIVIVHRQRTLSVLLVGLVTAGVFSSLLVFPCSAAYFNEAAGGPLEGKSHLLDANLDWGQDLFALKDWVDTHPEVPDLQVALLTSVPLEFVGTKARPVRSLLRSAPTRSAGVLPGWYAISVNELMGYRHDGTACEECMMFQTVKPVARIGYTIYIYHVPEPFPQSFPICADRGIDNNLTDLTHGCMCCLPCR